MPVTISGTTGVQGNITGNVVGNLTGQASELAPGGINNRTLITDLSSNDTFLFLDSTDQTLKKVEYSTLQAGVIQVTNHITTTRFQASVAGVSEITASSGSLYTSFNFTPRLSSSKLLLQSSTFLVAEDTNAADAMYAAASYDSTLIGTVLNYTSYSQWYAAYRDTTFVSFNHMFNSWGAGIPKTINIRCGSSSTTTVVVNFPPGDPGGTQEGLFNSPNQHQVTFTVMEIAV